LYGDPLSSIKSKAASFIINARKKCAICYAVKQGHLLYLVYNGSIWQNPVFCQGLTIFAINVSPNYSPDASKHELNTAMKYDNHLNDNTFENLDKQDTILPVNFYKMEIQFNLCIPFNNLFWECNLIPCDFKKTLLHLQLNYNHYKDSLTTAFSAP
jgi:hypothetical protein